MISMELRTRLAIMYIRRCTSIEQVYQAYYWRFDKSRFGKYISTIESAYMEKMHEFKDESYDE